MFLQIGISHVDVVESNGKSNAPQSTTNPLQSADNFPDPDLFVFAFQELDLSTEALLYSTKTAREEAWTMALTAALGEKGELYEKLASKQLVGMLIIILVKKNLPGHFSDIKSSIVGAGIMGLMGNKGAVSVRLTYHPPPTVDSPSPLPTALTFVNSHLAAFEEMLDRRNADFHDLSRRLSFPLTPQYVSPTQNGVGALSVYHSDVLIWMVSALRSLSHLNYRINLPDEDVRTTLVSEPSAISTMASFDQLSQSMRTKKAFNGFTEHPIHFAPTYRFNASLMTDGLGYDMKRKPAWTDRILYMSSSFTTVEQTSYTSHPQITMSDHKPVSADFEVEMPFVDCLELDSTANELFTSVANLDLEDLSEVPSMKLADSSVDFGTVSYDRAVTRTLSLQNTSKIPSAFRFYSREPSRPTHPGWLRIEPMTGFLLPSEQIEITFTVHVTRTTAFQLNIRAEHLQSISILHTLLGKDHFVSLHGQYEPTCFATALSMLTRLPGPIRTLQSPADLLPASQVLSAPREIMRLVNWLMSHDIETINEVFLVPGDQDLMASIRECLDTNAEFPERPAGSETKDSTSLPTELAHAVANTLLALLESLPEPVIPPALHPRCTAATNRDEAFEILDVLPAVSVNVWISVTALLHFLSAHEPPPPNLDNALSKSSTAPSVPVMPSDPFAADLRPSRAARLASAFAPALLRSPSSDSHLTQTADPVSPLAKQRFLMYFIAP
ncbi:hypothetical protein HETIRDRAFT_105366 [Heterobasidion irregulare TC 32-1]|uniref:Rho-GAP domain-containing protein n=1 Tax=Heterobasidion irregulare (strain TC 32-1) TaxID=747525 RepID=W4JVB5_HETIT|nr:uncharacterized protein HETIRDRAFT_105366 [Heterobasidion irregulare TC 32-1]ETW77518.1 hypothetical protein HETIRDRAFT_105366 [Heterobasidion irregulare TC 32-1]